MRLIPRGRSGLWLVLLIVVCLPAVSLAVGARDVSRTLTQSDTEVSFEIDLSDYRLEASPRITGTTRLVVPGFGNISDAGEPALPGRAFAVALPPAGGYTLSYQIIEVQSLGAHRLEPVPYPAATRDGEFASMGEEYRIDDAVYDGLRAAVSIHDAGVSKLRNQRVLAVQVQPVSYNAQSGETTLATKIRITVTFQADQRSGFDTPLQRPVIESSSWDRIYDRILVNPERADQWRVRPIRSSALSTPPEVAMALTGPHVKLQFEDTGLYKVRASSVMNRGIPAGTALADLHLFKRGYDEATLAPQIIDIGFEVVEDGAGSSGVFDGNDMLVFYGRGLRDDAAQGDRIAKFSDDNVYWLGATAGSAMAQKNLPVVPLSPNLDSDRYTVVRQFQRDLFFMEETPPDQRDFFYFNAYFVPSFSTAFSLGAIDPASNFRITAEILGRGVNNDRTISLRILNSMGTVNLPDLFIRRDDVAIYQQTVSAALIVEGVNTFRIDPTSRVWVDACLNWFRVDYEAPYRAVGDEMTFNSGTLTGTTTLSLRGLTRTDVLLFDISNPDTPERCVLNAGHFTDLGGGEFALSIQDDFTQQRDYVLAPLSLIDEITLSDVVADVPSAIIGNPFESGVDVLVVSHASFMPEMQRWVDHRRSQGYRVYMVDVADVYDEFTGGMPQARAIRRFTRHFFQTGNASFLVLVGDASEDNKTVHPNESAPNFVATESFTEFVGAGFNENEVVTTDKWYVIPRDFITFGDSDLPLPVLLDFAPDLFVGRLPAGNVAEIRSMVNKIIAYEQPSADETWRRRIIRISDDAWSPGAIPTELCFKPGELGFEQAEEDFAATTETAFPGGFDVIRLYLGDVISYPSAGCISTGVQQTQTRTLFVPQMFNEINQGALIVGFQAHMNRHQIANEVIFTSSAAFNRDHRRINNIGKPFLMFGMGCHLSDYAIHKELIRTTTNDINGDCISEILLLLPNRGAIGAHGSSGFEYLGPNRVFTGILADNFHITPPNSALPNSGSRQVRWIAGELLTAAEIENLLTQGFGNRSFGSGGVGMVKRYHLLGDPVLWMDAGPPRFDVTVDGQPFSSGDSLGGGTVAIRASIRDEVAIDRLTLWIDGVEESNQLNIQALSDQTLDASRHYQVDFTHDLLPKNYNIIVRAEQRSDGQGGFSMVGEFLFQVVFLAVLKVDGRPIVNGDPVPPVADYVFDLTSPTPITPDRISVRVDTSTVDFPTFIETGVMDGTNWDVKFSADLEAGPHTFFLFVDNAEFPTQVVVSTQVGLQGVVPYPNPFREEVHFVFTNEVAINDGRIDIFTVSGRKIMELAIPSSARGVGQNSVRWDGRDWAGDRIANGTYLYVINVDQSGQQSTSRGKLVHLE